MQRHFMHWDTYFVFNSNDSRLDILVVVYDGFVSTLNVLLELDIVADSKVDPNSAVLLPSFLLNVRSARILDTIIWSGH